MLRAGPISVVRNRFVHVAVSPRARGLTVGINMNPDGRCNFDCVYCEVDRRLPPHEAGLDVPVMILELERILEMVLAGQLHALPGFQSLPEDLQKLRHVALTGDGEPTLCPHFTEVVKAIVHLRALGRFPFFGLVLISNASGLDHAVVEAGLKLFTPSDELWLKLDAGSAGRFERIARTSVPFTRIIDNILRFARTRPVVIQSLFPMLDGNEPTAAEVNDYVARIRELVAGGARISLVQIYSAMRSASHPDCRHLPLRSLSRIAHVVRDGTGLPVEVY